VIEAKIPAKGKKENAPSEKTPKPGTSYLERIKQLFERDLIE
jgi:hypothetical protein